MYTNCDQLSNKQDELLLQIYTEKPDLIFLTEVLPKSHTTFNKLHIPGFILFDNCDTVYPSNLSRRGIYIYVAGHLQTSEITLHSQLIEHLWIKIKLQNNDSLLAGCIYCSPSLPTLDSTMDLCQLIRLACDLKTRYLLITGDFNYRNINWINDIILSDSVCNNLFLDTIHDYLLCRHVTEPTQYRFDTDPHILDLVLTNEEEMVDNMTYLHGLGKSDHTCILFDILCYTKKQNKSFEAFDFKKANFDELINKLEAIDWVQVLDPLNANQAWTKFTHIFTSYVQLTIPFCTIRPTKVNPYINSKVLKLKRKKLYFWKEYCRSGNQLNYSRFAHTCNALRSLTRSLRLNYEKNIMKNSKTNPQMFWKYVRSKVKYNIPSLEDEDGSIAVTNYEKAEVRNTFLVVCSHMKI